MEFNEKLQQLRKRKGLTQEELADLLYVSRTAVSKWESGRGYPNIDSLRDIAKTFSVTVDELLSGEELLVLVQQDQKQKRKRLCESVFGMLDMSAAIFLFLPFFAQRLGGKIEAVSLLSLTTSAAYTKSIYFAFVMASILWGVAGLVLNRKESQIAEKKKANVSLFLNALGILLFTVGLQPYAAVLLFLFLLLKLMLLAKTA